MRKHSEFYTSPKLRKWLKRLASPDDTPGRVRLKMLAACAGADARLDSILEHLLDEYAGGQQEKRTLIERANLSSFLWEQVEKTYGYQSDNPGLYDFTIELFKSCYAMGTDGDVRLNTEALVLLKRWKDSRQHEQGSRSCRASAPKCCRSKTIWGGDLRELVELDYFELIDRKVLSDLVAGVLARTMTAGQCTQMIRQRRSSHWFGRFRDMRFRC